MHREIQQFGLVEWLLILGFSVFLWGIDKLHMWLDENWRAVPAPHVGLSEPTTIQAKVAAEADKRQEVAGGQP